MRKRLSDAIEEMAAWSKTNPLGSQDEAGKNATVGFVIQSDFNPNFLWIVEEVEIIRKETNDMKFFGYANLDDDMFAEFGYASLGELLSIEEQMGLKYDDSCEGKTIVETMERYEQEVPDWLLEEPALD